jgi:5''-nucleotidase/2'',3''-cyclic phosphodiesterase and related esterases
MTTTLNRRQFMKLMAAAAAAGSVPAMYSARAFSQQSAPDGFYDAPMQGDARILHITDVHGQLLPVYSGT